MGARCGRKFELPATLHSLAHCGCLSACTLRSADEMGLGKTVQCASMVGAWLCRNARPPGPAALLAQLHGAAALFHL